MQYSRVILIYSNTDVAKCFQKIEVIHVTYQRIGSSIFTRGVFSFIVLFVNIWLAFQCRELLRVRQQLIAEDVKVQKGFYDACYRDIKLYNCVYTDSTLNGEAARSKILMCLEKALRNGNKSLYFLDYRDWMIIPWWIKFKGCIYRSHRKVG